MKADWSVVEREVSRAELLGDPMAPILRVLLDERREGITQEALHRLAYEAAAGARTEVRKLVQLEIKRQLPRMAAGVLLAVAAGFGLCWLTFLLAGMGGFTGG